MKKLECVYSSLLCETDEEFSLMGGLYLSA